MLPTSITVIGGGYAGAVGVFFFLFLPLNDLDSPKLLLLFIILAEEKLLNCEQINSPEALSKSANLPNCSQKPFCYRWNHDSCLFGGDRVTLLQSAEEGRQGGWMVGL